MRSQSLAPLSPLYRLLQSRPPLDAERVEHGPRPRLGRKPDKPVQFHVVESTLSYVFDRLPWLHIEQQTPIHIIDTDSPVDRSRGARRRTHEFALLFTAHNLARDLDDQIPLASNSYATAGYGIVGGWGGRPLPRMGSDSLEMRGRPVSPTRNCAQRDRDLEGMMRQLPNDTPTIGSSLPARPRGPAKPRCEPARHPGDAGRDGIAQAVPLEPPSSSRSLARATTRLGCAGPDSQDKHSGKGDV